MGKWVISKPYQNFLDNIQTLPNYFLLIKNLVLSIIFELGRVGHLLPNGYSYPYSWVVALLHSLSPHLVYFLLKPKLACKNCWVHRTRLANHDQM